MRSVFQILGVLILSAVVVACFRGGERDKEAPVGLPGGLCLGPDGRCDEGTCNKDRNFCYDPMDPCDGFFCGGEERGLCAPDEDGQPRCTCQLPYSNELFDLYCCPTAESTEFDPKCMMAGEIADEPSQR
ncbi:MAG: hypothetical protein AAF721_26550 [Myxococcota bacterium]